MLQPLDTIAKDVAFAQGFLEEWVSGITDPKVKDHVMTHLKSLIEGVSYWRDLFVKLQEDFQTLNSNYTNLSVVHGQTLQQMQFLRDQNTELLVEQQKDLHIQHANPVG